MAQRTQDQGGSGSGAQAPGVASDPNNEYLGAPDYEAKWAEDRLPLDLARLDPHPQYYNLPEVGSLFVNGQLQVDRNGKPLRAFNMPRYLPAEIPYWRMEAYFRLHPDFKYYDLWQRMPTTVPEPDTRFLHAENMRRLRQARRPYRVRAWDKASGNKVTAELAELLQELTPEQIALNTTWPIEGEYIVCPTNPNHRYHKRSCLWNPLQNHSPSGAVRRTLVVIPQVHAEAQRNGVQDVRDWRAQLNKMFWPTALLPRNTKKTDARPGGDANEAEESGSVQPRQRSRPPSRTPGRAAYSRNLSPPRAGPLTAANPPVRPDPPTVRPPSPPRTGPQGFMQTLNPFVQRGNPNPVNARVSSILSNAGEKFRSLTGLGVAEQAHLTGRTTAELETELETENAALREALDDSTNRVEVLQRQLEEAQEMYRRADDERIAQQVELTALKETRQQLRALLQQDPPAPVEGLEAPRVPLVVQQPAPVNPTTRLRVASLINWSDWVTNHLDTSGGKPPDSNAPPAPAEKRLIITTVSPTQITRAKGKHRQEPPASNERPVPRFMIGRKSAKHKISPPTREGRGSSPTTHRPGGKKRMRPYVSPPEAPGDQQPLTGRNRYPSLVGMTAVSPYPMVESAGEAVRRANEQKLADLFGGFETEPAPGSGLLDPTGFNYPPPLDPAVRIPREAEAAAQPESSTAAGRAPTTETRPPPTMQQPRARSPPPPLQAQPQPQPSVRDSSPRQPQRPVPSGDGPLMHQIFNVVKDTAPPTYTTPELRQPPARTLEDELRMAEETDSQGVSHEEEGGEQGVDDASQNMQGLQVGDLEQLLPQTDEVTADFLAADERFDPQNFGDDDNPFSAANIERFLADTGEQPEGNGLGMAPISTLAQQPDEGPLIPTRESQWSPMDVSMAETGRYSGPSQRQGNRDSIGALFGDEGHENDAEIQCDSPGDPDPFSQDPMQFSRESWDAANEIGRRR